MNYDIDNLKTIISHATDWLISYQIMMQDLHESHVMHLHPEFQQRFYQGEIDGLDGFVFGTLKPVEKIKEAKIVRIGELARQQKLAEQGISCWPSEFSLTYIQKPSAK